MKTRRSATPKNAVPSLAPFFAWNHLSLRWMEMMAASSKVIAHRSTRANNAAQLFRMGNEKVLASLEAAHGMAPSLLKLGTASGPQAWSTWLRVMSSAMAPYHARATRNARAISPR